MIRDEDGRWVIILTLDAEQAARLRVLAKLNDRTPEYQARRLIADGLANVDA